MAPDSEASPTGLSRRTVLRAAGHGAFALAAGSALGTEDTSQGLAQVLPPKRIEFPPIHAESEQKNPPPPAPFPPQGKVGFALVGLGRLTVEELLPAFAQTERCRPTALVSGDRAKALELARQYGIPERSVYSYGDFDRIRDNPDVQVVYVVLPNSMHEEFTVRAARAGKHVLCEKPMATSVARASED